MRLQLFFWIFIFLCSANVFGALDPCHKSTEGKDFWFGFMEGRNTAQYSPYMEVTLTSSYQCNYNLFIGKSLTPAYSGIVFPNIPVKIRISDWRLVQAVGSESIQEKAIHLVSDNPLNVYALNFAFNSSEVATIFPTESLGSEYYAMCYDPHVAIHTDSIYGLNIQGKNSEFLIAATEDNTIITITPSVVTDKLRSANAPFQITLSRGELYQVQSANEANLPGQGDLTGSYVTSDKPVALFSGSYSTTVPNSSTSAWDHLFEQIPPVQTWGRKFITVPLKSRLKDTYRILASEDNTSVHVGNLMQFVINKGQFKEFSLLYTQPSLVESDKPVLLAQFSNSNSVDYGWNGGDGDPFLVIVSPVNQQRQKVAFVAYDSPEITKKFFINVVVQDDAIGKIQLDGTNIAFTSVKGSGYSYAQDSLTKGSHYIASTDPTKGFIAYVYGFGGFEGYGYGVGYNLDIVLDVGGIVDPNGGKSIFQCFGSPPVTLNAGNTFDSYLWSTGDTTSTIQVSKSGWYKVLASQGDCKLTDSVEFKIDKPIVNLGNDTTICNPKNLVLDAGKNFSSYIWSNKQIVQKINVKTPGTYSVNVVDSYGCKAGDTIKVNFTNNPKMNLTAIDTLICGKKSDILTVSADKGSFSFQRLRDKFIFNSPDVSVLEFGSYKFDIKVTDQYYCTADSIVNISFRDVPDVGFTVDSTQCYQFDPIVKYSGNAKINISDFTWIYGGDTISRGIGLDTFKAPIGNSMTVKDIKLIVKQQGCSNNKTLTGIKVIPGLKLSVVDSIGCEPLTVKFVASNTQATSYVWDFGDGSVLNGSQWNPSHTYLHSGKYPVKVKLTMNNGCINEAGMDSTIHVMPVPSAGFTPLPSGCLDKGNHEISYLGDGTPYDRYIWDLSKLDPAEIIKNPLETQGPLIFNLMNKPQSSIGLKVISKFGCVSQESSVKVKRKPDFSIESSSNKGCPPFKAQFSASANDPVDQLTYNWDFGDGTSGTGSRVNHMYTVPDQKYDIILNALSSLTGCSDTLLRKELVMSHQFPSASFTVDHQIVYIDKPTVHFSNSSTGANTFLWNFGDGKSSDLKDPEHDFSASGLQTVVLEVFNEFMCSDTVSTKILVASNQLFPPNGFSPNAPEVIDREYKLSAPGIAPKGYHLVILSRWNDLVFETKDEIKGWDGRMLNGTFAPSGVYVWILNFSDFLGRTHRQTGTVTLVY